MCPSYFQGTTRRRAGKNLKLDVFLEWWHIAPMPVYEEVMSPQQLGELHEGQHVIVNVKGESKTAEFLGPSKYEGYATVRVDGKKVVRRVIRSVDGESTVAVSTAQVVEPESDSVFDEASARDIRKEIMHALSQVRQNRGLRMRSGNLSVTGESMSLELHIMRNERAESN